MHEINRITSANLHASLTLLPILMDKMFSLVTGYLEYLKDQGVWRTSVFQKMKKVLRYLEISSVTPEEAFSKVFYR